MNPDHQVPDGTPMVTLSCGEAVFNTDPRWAAECMARHRHVMTLRALGLDARRTYLLNVAQSEGAESAKRLKDAFAKDWEERRAAERAEKEAMKP